MAKKIKTAVLEEDAFVALLTSALEVYDKETYGLLIGYSIKDKIKIKNAIPCQNAVRKKNEVYIRPSHETKIRFFLGNLTGHKIIGDFHSHPLWPRYLSDYDVKDMVENGERITLLIVIEKFKRKFAWHYNKKDKSLMGTIDDKYFVIVKVYMRDYGRKAIRKLKICCNYIKKLNKLNCE
jgi:proteasome lid subunit RPN8/RPN11